MKSITDFLRSRLFLVLVIVALTAAMFSARTDIVLAAISAAITLGVALGTACAVLVGKSFHAVLFALGVAIVACIIIYAAVAFGMLMHSLYRFWVETRPARMRFYISVLDGSFFVGLYRGAVRFGRSVLDGSLFRRMYRSIMDHPGIFLMRSGFVSAGLACLVASFFQPAVTRVSLDYFAVSIDISSSMSGYR